MQELEEEQLGYPGNRTWELSFAGRAKGPVGDTFDHSRGVQSSRLQFPILETGRSSEKW